MHTSIARPHACAVEARGSKCSRCSLCRVSLAPALKAFALSPLPGTTVQRNKPFGTCRAALKSGSTLTQNLRAPTLHQQAQEKLLEPAALFPLRNVREAGPLFYVYFPIGVVVASVRVVLWITLLLLDQAWLTNNDTSIAVLQAILGVRVEWRGSHRIPKQRHVLVSNHVTTGDLIALYSRPQTVVHLISTALPKRVSEARHHRVDLRHACLETYDALGEEGERDSVHLFPEGGMTNGAGMMKFSRGFLRFADGLPVVPVALRARLPWGISTHTLTSSFLSNLFWFCFCPVVSLELTVLQPTQRETGESKAHFVERVQQAIAEELEVPILDFTIQAKKKLMQSAMRRQQSH